MVCVPDPSPTVHDPLVPQGDPYKGTEHPTIETPRTDLLPIGTREIFRPESRFEGQRVRTPIMTNF